MAFVSFAQNAEDLMLWRALRDVRDGFWIDVGAADPDDLSVTRAFHDRGWTGVNIEPNRFLFNRLVAARPRDVNLAVALGGTAGERAFHVFGETGLSCFDDAIAAVHREAGYDETTGSVPVMTLADVCERHAPDTIHFLKIDVEGAEAEVLSGADWRRFRPWIVLAEATRPLSPEQTHAEWEADLVRADYRFVWFDGVNRFYVAAERYAALAAAFAAPPNALDDWTRASEDLLRIRAERAEGDAGLARAEHGRGEKALDRARADLTSLRVRVDEAEAALRDARRAADEAHGAAEALRQAVEVERVRLDRARDAERDLSVLLARRFGLRADLDAALRRTMRPVRRALRAAPSAARRLASRIPRVGEAEPGAAEALPGPGTAPVPIETEASAPRAEPEPTRPAPAAGPALPGDTPDPRPRATTPCRIVHQYHHATAVGDAVSGSLFLLRSRLRALGFASEIFAAHPHPDHRDEVGLIDELPTHADYVLIVHHSLGDPTAERLVALAARKVLFYHNITPASLLAFDPTLVAFARLGRTQLDLWRRHASAAIAPSEVNAMELRRHGFDAVEISPCLFDFGGLTARAAAARHARAPDAPLTVLFVGRILPSKGQADLVDAFGVFRRLLGPRPARLVLVGRDFGDADAYRASIIERAEAGGFRDAVLLTGGVDDPTLDHWYAEADLYVSMSRHEGFGVPLVEAMAHDVPVLARAAGAVAFTLGDAGVLVEGGADEMGAAMAALASDAAARAAVRRAQQRRLLELAARQTPSLLAALATAGAVPPTRGTDAATTLGELRITVAGHVNGSYSLASVNRALALALEAAAPGRTRVLPVEDRPDAPLFSVPDDEYVPLADLASRPPVLGCPHVVLSQHYPVWVPADGDLGQDPDLLVAFFFWEESLVPDATVSLLNERFDAVLAPSRFVARALLDSGVRIPVRVVGHAPPLAAFSALASRPERGHSRPFTFLHVSSAFPRKGVDLLLAAWQTAFTPDDAVRLVLKTFPNPHNTIRADLDALRARHADLAPIVLLDGELEPEDLRVLYLGADAMVLPSRGEGFNIPAAEAMAVGLPLITSAVGGHVDFAGPDTAILIEGHHAPAGTHLAQAGSLWFEPDPAALASAMQEVAARRPEAAARAARARAGVLRALDPVACANRMRETLGTLLSEPRPAAASRIGILTTWGVRCGIAEYARQLVAGRPAEWGGVITILADRRTLPDRSVVPAWDPGAAFRPDETARAIAAADPEILLIQHQPGLISWGSLAALLRDRRLQGRAIAVTLHNTRHLWAVDTAGREEALAALADVARVIVHTVDGFDRFRTEGFQNVVMIPQGAPAPVGETPPATDPAAPVIGTYGFLLAAKGLGSLVEAFGLLRRTHPGARLRMVTSDYDDGSPSLRAALASRAAELGIADAIDWHTDFLPHAESLALLSGCDVIVMPYEPTLEASSAALRTALASLRPIVVTPLPIFREAEDVVLVLPEPGAEAIRAGVETLLADPARRDRMVEAERAWLAGRDWRVIARRTFGMLDGIFGEEASRAGRAGTRPDGAGATITTADALTRV